MAKMPEQRRTQRWIIANIVLGAMIIVAISPYVHQQGPILPGLTPLCVGAMMVSDIVVSFLLFSLFTSERRWSSLILAACYMHASLMTLLYFLTFPSAIVPDASLIGGPALGLWPYGFWVIGYGLLLLAATVTECLARGRLALAHQTRPAVLLAIGATLIIDTALTCIVLIYPDLLPVTLVNGKLTRLAAVIGNSVNVLLVISIVLGLLSVRRDNAPSLWVAIAAAWMLVSNILGIMANGRFTIGWSCARLCATVSVCSLLIFFLSRLRLQYHVLKMNKDDLESTVAARTAELIAEISGRQAQNEKLVAALAALQQNEVRLDQAQEIASLGHWELALDTGRYRWSAMLYRIRGLTVGVFEPTLHNCGFFVYSDDKSRFSQWQSRLLAGEHVTSLDIRLLRFDGELRYVRLEGQAIRDEQNLVRGIIGTEQDITERSMLERALVQSQKLDAIGTLTGGIAHDFNNHLSVIIANVEDACEAPQGAGQDALANIMSAAKKSAELISRLLAFARDQPLSQTRTDVNQLVTHCGSLLRPILGEEVTLTTTLDAAVWPVVIDPVQLEAAIVNLCTNARDAMPKGGVIEISTANTVVGPMSPAPDPNVAPGEYVVVSVRDNGSGIPEHIIGQIFDPFFTTKAPGKGTGLGLSTAFGFCKQSGGALTVQSETGRGAVFCLYLPHSQTDRASSASCLSTGTQMPAARRTILLVDDNAAVRNAIARQTAALGHLAYEAADARSALRRIATDSSIDLLITDTIMPGPMNGADLAVEAHRLRPQMPIILISGFAHIGHLIPGDDGANFARLRKPFTRQQLASVIDARFAAVVPLPEDTDLLVTNSLPSLLIS